MPPIYYIVMPASYRYLQHELLVYSELQHKLIPRLHLASERGLHLPPQEPSVEYPLSGA